MKGLEWKLQKWVLHIVGKLRLYVPVKAAEWMHRDTINTRGS